MMRARQRKMNAEMKTNQEQMKDQMKPETEANQAKADVSLMEIKEEMKIPQAEMKADREVMLARIEVSQEREDTNLKEVKEQILAKMGANQAKTHSTQEKMNANPQYVFREKMDASITDRKDGRKERTVCQDAAEANPEKMESIPEMMKSIAEHRKAVRSSGALKKWHKGRYLAAGRRREPKEMARENCGSRSKLDAARRRMTCRAGVARRRG
jgi:hypothetical protein